MCGVGGGWREGKPRARMAVKRGGRLGTSVQASRMTGSNEELQIEAECALQQRRGPEVKGRAALSSSTMTSQKPGWDKRRNRSTPGCQLLCSRSERLTWRFTCPQKRRCSLAGGVS